MLASRLSVGFALLLTGCASIPGPGSTRVRVLVYNIHAGTDAERRDNLERVAEIIRQSRADIVLLQEVDRLTLFATAFHRFGVWVSEIDHCLLALQAHCPRQAAHRTRRH